MLYNALRTPIAMGALDVSHFQASRLMIEPPPNRCDRVCVCVFVCDTIHCFINDRRYEMRSLLHRLDLIPPPLPPHQHRQRITMAIPSGSAQAGNHHETDKHQAAQSRKRGAPHPDGGGGGGQQQTERAASSFAGSHAMLKQMAQVSRSVGRSVGRSN